jgi:hypothetical protein
MSLLSDVQLEHVLEIVGHISGFMTSRPPLRYQVQTDLACHGRLFLYGRSGQSGANHEDAEDTAEAEAILRSNEPRVSLEELKAASTTPHQALDT